MKLFLSINLFFAFNMTFAQESAFESIDSEPLTDQQVHQSNTYIHQGLADKKVQEMCEQGKSGYKDICEEDKYAFKEGDNLRKLESFLPALTKAYSMFNSVGGDLSGFTAKSLDDQGNQIYTKNGQQVSADVEGAKPKTETKKDYCGYIGMIGEAASTAYTALQNDQTEKNYTSSKPEAKQAASFYALADSHKTMAKAAKVQMGVWSASAACYVAYAAQAQFRGDWKVYAKMAAAGFIGYYYKKKADAHKEREKLLKKMAKELPQAGDCNPFTNKSCFCAEETSPTYDPGNYQAVCVPKELAQRNDADNDAYVCADQNGKADIECDCIKTNTCADQRLKVAGARLGLSPTVLKDPLATMKPLSKGLGTASLDSAANKNFALANKTLKKLKTKSLPKLNNNDKKLAKIYNENGIPKLASAILAGQKKGNKTALPTSALAGLNSSYKPKYSHSHKNTIRPHDSKLKRGNTAYKKNKSGSNFMNRFRKKKTAKKDSIMIEEYAKKAEREAEIVNDPSKGIFEIISYRYQMSAWREFKPVFSGPDKDQK